MVCTHWGPSFNYPPPTTMISIGQNQILLSPVFEEEIHVGLWSLDEDKAPRPDGFSSIFFRRY